MGTPKSGPRPSCFLSGTGGIFAHVEQRELQCQWLQMLGGTLRASMGDTCFIGNFSCLCDKSSGRKKG